VPLRCAALNTIDGEEAISESMDRRDIGDEVIFSSASMGGPAGAGGVGNTGELDPVETDGSEVGVRERPAELRSVRWVNCRVGCLACACTLDPESLASSCPISLQSLLLTGPRSKLSLALLKLPRFELWLGVRADGDWRERSVVIGGMRARRCELER